MDVGQIIAYLLTPVVQVALIIGLAELIKGLGIEKRWIPLVDLGLGLASGIFVYGIVCNSSPNAGHRGMKVFILTFPSRHRGSYLFRSYPPADPTNQSRTGHDTSR